MSRTSATYEWPIRLFKMRGFGRVDVNYVASRDVIAVTLARHSDGQPVTVDLPDNFASMTLQTFRAWVDTEVEKIMGPSDFPTISIRPPDDASPCELNPDSVNG